MTKKRTEGGHRMVDERQLHLAAVDEWERAKKLWEQHVADRAWCRHREVTGDDAKRRWKCARCGEPFTKASDAEFIARAERERLLANLTAGVKDWTDYPAFDMDRENFADGWCDRKRAVLALLAKAGRTGA